MTMNNILLKFLFTFFFQDIILCSDVNITQHGRVCEGEKNIWTVGYEKRSLQAIVHCTKCSKERNFLEGFLWCNGFKSCRAVALNPAYVAWIVKNETNLVSELTLFDPVIHLQNGSVYAFREVSDTSVIKPPQRIDISTEYCPSANKNNVTIEVSSTNSSSLHTYGDEGNFVCSSGELVNTAEKKLAENATTICGTCVKWERMDEMDCWRAPNASLKSTNSNGSYFASHILNATDICNVIDWGKPTAILSLSWNASNEEKEITSTLTLRAEDHDKTIYCAISNDLTDLMGTGPVLSHPLLLSIQFKPRDLSNRTSSCHGDDESILFNITLEVNFSANPIGRAEFLDKDGNNVDFTLTNDSHGCCGVFLQQYEIVLTNISADFSITFYYYQNDNKTLTRHKFEDLTKSCRPTILGSNTHVSGPEERENVLYGTTQLNSSGKNKEVVENVLYGTRGATDGPADEYAEVVPKAKRKKGKSNPKDNGTTAASAEATYAVVDKKRAGQSGSDNAGFSDDPQPEATYAVVNKKGKKS